MVVDKDFHAAWHKIFVNLTIEEVHRMIDIVMVPGGTWSAKDLDALRHHLIEETRRARRAS